MLPKLISLPNGFFLPTYGVLVAAGFLAAVWLAARLGRRSGLDPDSITSLGVNAALGGLIGAKLLLILENLDEYLAKPASLFTLATLQSGGVFFGGLLAATGVAWYTIRSRRLPLYPVLDCFAPAIALGHAIGRLGCFAAGCCWGLECRRPWAVTFSRPEAAELTGVPLGIPLHPAQLYEAAAQFLLAALLWKAWNRPHRPGQIFGLYLLGAALSRFVIDFFRAHESANPLGGPFSNAQLLALALALAGLWLLRRASPSAETPQNR
jgi:phosphatidylglycerol:prolipoprotein diacylglycerol transferase